MLLCIDWKTEEKTQINSQFSRVSGIVITYNNNNEIKE